MYAAVYVSCARPVHGGVHVPCMGPCTRHVHDRRRPYRHVHGWCRRITAVPYTRSIHGRVRAVYTARPLYGRVRAIVMGEDVFTGRVHAPYAAAQRPSTRPWTSRTRTCNCRVSIPCTPYTWRCNVCVHVSPAHGPSTSVYTAVHESSTRPKTAVYTAVHCDVTYRVYGSVRDVCTAVFGRVHWPCTLPFSAVYIARTRPAYMAV